MNRPEGVPRELTLPVRALAALRRAIVEEVGEETAARILRNAGGAAGDALHEMLNRDTAVQGWDQDSFWRTLADFFGNRGWGRVSHDQPHPGVAALESADWVEADPAGAEARPSCFFATGMFANLLARQAGQPVAVLEVECRSRGDLRCRFLFGAQETLQALYDSVADGVAVDEALSSLR
jgi:predicted hydrocarbon binding protein